MDEFTQAYIGAALWSTTDPDHGDDSLDKKYGPQDLAPATLEAIERDCAAFQKDNAKLLAKAYKDIQKSRAGFCFYMSRSGSGTGFFDEGLGAVGDKLEEASEAYGTFEIYPGDDGKLYAAGHEQRANEASASGLKAQDFNTTEDALHHAAHNGFSHFTKIGRKVTVYGPTAEGRTLSARMYRHKGKVHFTEPVISKKPMPKRAKPIEHEHEHHEHGAPAPDHKVVDSGSYRGVTFKVFKDYETGDDLYSLVIDGNERNGHQGWHQDGFKTVDAAKNAVKTQVDTYPENYGADERTVPELAPDAHAPPRDDISLAQYSRALNAAQAAAYDVRTKDVFRRGPAREQYSVTLLNKSQGGTYIFGARGDSLTPLTIEVSSNETHVTADDSIGVRSVPVTYPYGYQTEVESSEAHAPRPGDRRGGRGHGRGIYGRESDEAQTITYTTAPADYDWFGTHTIEIAGKDSRGRDVRKVSGPTSRVQAQRDRYGSGLHMAVDQTEWDKLVSYKLVTVESSRRMGTAQAPTRKPAKPNGGASTNTDSGGNPTSTSTKTEAYTQGNFTATVTGGAGRGHTNVTIVLPRVNGEEEHAASSHNAQAPERHHHTESRWDIPLDEANAGRWVEAQLFGTWMSCWYQAPAEGGGYWVQFDPDSPFRRVAEIRELPKGAKMQAAERLTDKQRKNLPDSAFALPKTRDLPLTGKNGKLDPRHVNNAAARLSMMWHEKTVSRAEFEEASRRIERARKKLKLPPSSLAKDCIGLHTHHDMGGDLINPPPPPPPIVGAPRRSTATQDFLRWMSGWSVTEEPGPDWLVAHHLSGVQGEQPGEEILFLRQETSLWHTFYLDGRTGSGTTPGEALDGSFGDLVKDEKIEGYCRKVTSSPPGLAEQYPALATSRQSCGAELSDPNAVRRQWVGEDARERGLVWLQRPDGIYWANATGGTFWLVPTPSGDYQTTWMSTSGDQKDLGTHPYASAVQVAARFDPASGRQRQAAEAGYTKYVVRLGGSKELYLQADGTWGDYETSKRFNTQGEAATFHNRFFSGENYGVFPVSRGQQRPAAGESASAPRYLTKKGKHGTLHKYRITYIDADDPGAAQMTWNTWAYNQEDAEQRFHDDGEGWKVISVKRLKVAAESDGSYTNPDHAWKSPEDAYNAGLHDGMTGQPKREGFVTWPGHYSDGYEAGKAQQGAGGTGCAPGAEAPPGRPFADAGKRLPTVEYALLVGPAHAKDTLRLRQFLSRNGHPFQYFDTEQDEGDSIIRQFALNIDELPAIVWKGHKYYKPSNREVADVLGFGTQVEGAQSYDVIIVGAGPSGLSCAVYAASEGLSCLVVEAYAPGGQAANSSRIENYAGFPRGISGADLASQTYMQAQKFGARFIIPTSADRLIKHGIGDFEIRLSDHSSVHGKSVVLACGAEWRKPDYSDLPKFEGAGVYYAATATEGTYVKGQDVVVVGGGNSAGQAAIFMSELAHKVFLIVRGKGLSDTMSDYLIKRIAKTKNIELLAYTEIVSLQGIAHLERVTWKTNGVERTEEVRHLFLMIGTIPKTDWLHPEGKRDCAPSSGWLGNCVILDEGKFIKTGADLVGPEWQHRRRPLAFETSMPGCFAVGDVRSGSVKRVATAVGEGAVAITSVHKALVEADTAKAAQ